jgi:thiol-disulfide isomerase/thioredoxin
LDFFRSEARAMKYVHFATIAFAVLLIGCTQGKTEEVAATDAAVNNQPADQAADVDETAASAEDETPSEETSAAAAAMGESMRAVSLASDGDVDEARAIVERLRLAAAELATQSPDDFHAFEMMALALKTKVDVEAALPDGDAEAAQQEFLAFLEERARASNDPKIRPWCELGFMQVASSLVRSDPDAAEALLDRLETLLASAGEPSDGGDEAAAPPSPARQRLRAMIATTRKQMALIGTPAAWPEQADRWVNAENGLTRDDLKGKVVLLDFFAVWCGPCIATFPHLREWQEEFGDRGFQVVGVTKYYGYDWNDETSRAVRAGDLAPDAERAALEKFVAHHELTHPIAMIPDDSFSQHYAVSGIPHAVIIDRQGNVGLYRIGSGEKTAADLRQAIEECLNEEPPAEVAQPAAAAAAAPAA